MVKRKLESRTQVIKPVLCVASIGFVIGFVAPKLLTEEPTRIQTFDVSNSLKRDNSVASVKSVPSTASISTTELVLDPPVAAELKLTAQKVENTLSQPTSKNENFTLTNKITTKRKSGFAPFGYPKVKVDLNEVPESAWKLTISEKRGRRPRKPKGLEESKERLFHSFTDIKTRITSKEIEELKTYAYWTWRTSYAETINCAPEPASLYKPYNYKVYTMPLEATIDVFDALEPKRQYIDWSIAHSDILAYHKTYASENKKDRYGRIVTAWNLPDVIIDEYKGEKDVRKNIERVLREMKKDNVSFEERVKLEKEFQKRSLNSATPMMTGYWGMCLLRTAESIYRHPELYDLELPDMGLPYIKDSSKTYLEKADFFFQAGLEAVEYFSSHPVFWDSKRGTYVNARGGGNEEGEHAVKAWNRSFSILRSQSIAVRLMKALDKDKYAPLIARYTKQMNQNLLLWRDNQRLVPGVQGDARSWAYAYVTPEKIDTTMGEDIGHATATLTLGVEVAENGADEFTPSVIRGIALNYLTHLYLPEDKDFGSHMWLAYQEPCDMGSMPFRSLSLVPYHRDIFPMLAEMMRYRKIGFPKMKYFGLDNMMLLYHGKMEYLKLLKDEKARIAAQPRKNTPPTIVSASKEIKLKRDAVKGTVLARVKAKDRDRKQKITYFITGGNEAKQLMINRNTGELSINPDLEVLTLDAVPNVITVTAADDGFPIMQVDTHIKVKTESIQGDISTGLLVHYEFNDNKSSDIIKDSVSSKNPGVFKDEQGYKPELVKDGRRTALSITSMGYVDVPKEALSNVYKKQVVTYAFWMKAPSVLPCPIIDSLCNKGHALLGIAASHNKIIWSAGGLWYAPVTDDLTYSSNYIPEQWNHWAFSKDKKSGIMLMFLNGKMVASRDKATHNLDHNNGLAIGSWPEVDKKKKKKKVKKDKVPSAPILIDDFRVYDRLLSISEVRNLYNSK